MTNDQNARPARDGTTPAYAAGSGSADAAPPDPDSRDTNPRGWSEAEMRNVLATHEVALIRYTTRLLHGDVERAREVVQDTFLRLCRTLPAEVETHLAEWLYTVCRNRARDVARKERRMTAFTDRESPASEQPIDARIAGRHSDGSAPPLIERTPGSGSMTDGHASLMAGSSARDNRLAEGQGRDMQHQVLNMLGTLSPNQQEVIRLKFQGGLTYKQISSVTELSVSNVGFLIHTGLKRLREQMQGSEHLPAMATSGVARSDTTEATPPATRQTGSSGASRPS